jgi:hypothetical protein
MRGTILLVIIVALLTSLILGCASIISGTKQDVLITSSPDQATLNIKNMNGMMVFQGKTPATVNLERNNSYIVTVSLPGYKDSQVSINRDFNFVFLGNLICGGLLGMIIDAVDGAMYQLEPNILSVTLVTASIKGNADEKYAVLQYKNDKGEVQTAATPLIKK